MFVFNNFFTALTNILHWVLNFYFWVVIVACIISWVQPDPYNPIVRTLRGLTEPVFSAIRKWLPFCYINGLDLSPIIALLLISFTRDFLITTLIDIAQRL